MNLANLKLKSQTKVNKKLHKKYFKKYLSYLDEGWNIERNGQGLIKEFVLKDFNEAIKLLTKVSELAEKVQHHPNFYLYKYKRLRIELSTHKIGGIHKNDFIMAAKIDKL